jgi:EAL domain-containing protein (putative c-di-GMP-specific phosphodiesterase class I)
VSVNVSSRYAASGHLAQDIRSCLEETGLQPSNLELEITESMLMDNLPMVRAVLGEIKGLGVPVAIDDFGTGYSSLAYLAQLPVDTLKIDRTFVRGLKGDGSSGEIVGTIVALARSMGMGIIAEGVETRAQRTRLRGLGCERAQGYLISRPLSAEHASDMISANGRLPALSS